MQRSIALRFTEAEYLALADATKTSQWLRTVLEELKFLQMSAEIYQDNMGAINCADGNPAKVYSRC